MNRGRFPVRWPRETAAQLADISVPMVTSAQSFTSRKGPALRVVPGAPKKSRSAHATWNSLPDGALDWVATGAFQDPLPPPAVATWYLQSGIVPAGYRGLVQQITWDNTGNPSQFYDWPLYLLLGPPTDISTAVGGGAGAVHPQSLYPSYPWLNAPANASMQQFSFAGADASNPLSVSAFGTLECDLWVPANATFIVAMANSPADGWTFSISGWIIPESDLLPELGSPPMPIVHRAPTVPVATSSAPAPRVVRFVTPEQAMGLAMQGWVSVRAVPSRADLDAGRSMAMSPPA